MKRIIPRIFNTLPKRIAAGLIAAVLVSVPVAVIAANQVTITGTTGVGNVTAGDTQYSSSVNATYDQIVKVQVTYDNTEAPGSNLVANDVNVKINIPTTPGTSQVINTVISGSNTNTVNGQATVNLSDPTSYLQYIPGSAVAKVTATNGTISEFSIPDDVALGSGYNINNGNPCQSASVTVLARDMVPGISIVKQSEILGQSNAWSNDNTAAPGDTLKYLITYKNTGNTTENAVSIGDNLPPKMQLVNGTTMIYNSAFPNGTPDTSNNITSGGITIGNYAPGTDAYVEFNVTIPQASDLACGVNEFRNVGVATAQGMDQYYNTAVTDVTVPCASTPTYSCNSITLNTVGDREIEVSTNTTATNGATLTSVTYDFGDNSTPLTTNAATTNYTYANYGSYTVTATATFSVNGSPVTATSASCTKTVSFTSPATPTSTTPSTPSQLVNTGPGDVIGLFAATTIAGAVGHRLFKARQLARNSK
jgi:uncharacterized repeat protein (TIGR01451 family)